MWLKEGGESTTGEAEEGAVEGGEVGQHAVDEDVVDQVVQAGALESNVRCCICTWVNVESVSLWSWG